MIGSFHSQSSSWNPHLRPPKQMTKSTYQTGGVRSTDLTQVVSGRVYLPLCGFGASGVQELLTELPSGEWES